MHTGIPQQVELDVLLPVYNEAESIEITMDEIYNTISQIVNMRFIITEDGSTDGTFAVLEKLTTRYPIKLISGSERKGYSQAVIDGLHVVEAPYVLCLDSDGQCDPNDFVSFWQQRAEADVLVGWRIHRQDVRLRKFLSGLFKVYYRTLFKVFLHDPSCPFVLAPRTITQQVLPRLGVLSQGFWWEFVARLRANGYTMGEIPVNHRLRSAGQTQIYRLNKLPAIGWTHAKGLLRIWQDYRLTTTKHIPASMERR